MKKITYFLFCLAILKLTNTLLFSPSYIVDDEYWKLRNKIEETKTKATKKQTTTFTYIDENKKLIKQKKDIIKHWIEPLNLRAVKGKQQVNFPNDLEHVPVNNPSSKWALLSKFPNKKLILWSISQNRQKTNITHSQQITTANFSPNGNLLATGDKIGNVKVWNFHNNKSTSIKLDLDLDNIEKQRHKEIHNLTFSFDNKKLLVEIRRYCFLIDISKQNTQGLFNYEVVERWEHLALSNYATSFSPDGKYIVKRDRFDLLDGATIRQRPFANNYIYIPHRCRAVSFSEHRFALASQDEILIWNINNFRNNRQAKAEQRLLRSNRNYTSQLSWSYDGKFLAALNEGGSLDIWQMSDGKKILFHFLKTKPVAIQFSKNYLISVSGKKSFIEYRLLPTLKAMIDLRTIKFNNPEHARIRDFFFVFLDQRDAFSFHSKMEISISPDNRFLAYGVGGLIVFINLTTKKADLLPGTYEQVLQVFRSRNFNPDNKILDNFKSFSYSSDSKLISANINSNAYVWSTQNLKLLCKITGGGNSKFRYHRNVAAQNHIPTLLCPKKEFEIEYIDKKLSPKIQPMRIKGSNEKLYFNKDGNYLAIKSSRYKPLMKVKVTKECHYYLEQKQWHKSIKLLFPDTIFTEPVTVSSFNKKRNKWFIEDLNNEFIVVYPKTSIGNFPKTFKVLLPKDEDLLMIWELESSNKSGILNKNRKKICELTSNDEFMKEGVKTLSFLPENVLLVVSKNSIYKIKDWHSENYKVIYKKHLAEILETSIVDKVFFSQKGKDDKSKNDKSNKDNIYYFITKDSRIFIHDIESKDELIYPLELFRNYQKRASDISTDFSLLAFLTTKAEILLFDLARRK